MPTPQSLSTLPQEILGKIFGYVLAGEVVKVRLVKKAVYFKFAAHVRVVGGALLKRKIKLAHKGRIIKSHES